MQIAYKAGIFRQQVCLTPDTRSMHTLLLELFSEEIPASMQHLAAQNLQQALHASVEQRFGVQVKTEILYTPRRLALLMHGIPTQTIASSEEIRGPRLDAPEAALSGFMRKYNIRSTEELVQRDGFYYHQRRQLAEPAAKGLPTLVEAAIAALVWPKSMRWGAYKIRWVRPLHSIICMLDDEVIPAQYGPLTASNQTSGHRFLHQSNITISSATSYKDQLQQAYVICDSKERQATILSAIDALLKPLQLSLIKDEDLLTEVSGLVEYPVVLLGTIPEEFMALPPEVLITTLRNNQKYLMTCAPDGALAPYFIIVSNNKAADGGKQIIAGNRKVLVARLSDAMFFYEQDRKQPLISRLDALKNITFQEKIGSVYEKVIATKELANNIAPLVGAGPKLVDRACELAKADLTTSMVKEFPELQGIMGYHYAISEGEPEAIALAVLEHYKPLGPSDYAPKNPVSIAVALADKIYTITCMFAADLKPTGSKDPYALRRAAIGIIRIILENNLDLQLSTLINSPEVLAFITERFKVICKEMLSSTPENIGTLLAESGHDLNAVFASLKHNDSV
ncbi:MAG: glycine--tRNA ligase subunit beta [Proteobacteria bacterium]|nr:glycine--tRNA ligase subunit beta [Pseudomonadota bacterium]